MRRMCEDADGNDQKRISNVEAGKAVHDSRPQTNKGGGKEREKQESDSTSKHRRRQHKSSKSDEEVQKQAKQRAMRSKLLSRTGPNDENSLNAYGAGAE